jgi:p-aminobenzoyl-glutamate transporter AbgT
MQHPLAAMFVAFAVGAAGGFSAGVLVVIADFRRKR